MVKATFNWHCDLCHGTVGVEVAMDPTLQSVPVARPPAWVILSADKMVIAGREFTGRIVLCPGHPVSVDVPDPPVLDLPPTAELTPVES